MPLQSKRTVRLHEIPAKTTKGQYDDFVNHLCTKPKKGSGFRSALASHFKSKSKPKPTLPSLKGEPEVSAESKEEPKTPSTNNEAEQAVPLLDNRDDVHRLTTKGWIETTFCLQHGQPVGTISFENEVLKNEAMERHEKDKNSCWNSWTVEDNFKGVTILHEVSDAKVDIFAVHGLGGNAIDTWTANSGRMWFRDFLPEHENLKSSRIMTFGYDSDLTDRSTVMELENWAETLLRSLNEVRTGEKEKERPLLFVSHSLGGLIVRKAMARLHLSPNCQNIKLSQCGIVFLATPHSGSTKADWSNFLVATAHAIGGVRLETVKTLQSFNTASVWDTAAFLNLSPCPPFRCFAEGLRMRVKGTNQHIVTQASATLGKDQAFMIMDVDHSSICKFRSRMGAFVTITMALRELLSEVTSGGVQQPRTQQERHMFGQPRFLAHAYPPDRGFWWEGNELNEIQHKLTTTRPFFGRSKELETLERSLNTDEARPKLTAIKGIAGIGKTELLLQFAARQRGHRNVFFLAPHDRETIDSAVSKLSTRIGFDMIDDPVVNQERWRSTPVSERIHIFITWLGEACNRESLFIVDDIEAFGYSKIPIILKYPAHHVLVSTRDSNLRRADRDFQESRLSPLGHEDTIRILQSTLKSLSAEPAYWKDLGSISNRIQGHPLAARNVIAFITEYLATDDNPSYAFSNLFESQDPEERKVFFEFSFEGRSIWEAFDTSLKRLELQGNPQSAAKLLQILPFLCLDNNSVDDFLKMDKRWLRDCEDELPDMAMLKAGYTVMSSWLSKLRAVSFYVRSDSSSHTKGLNIHPLISQYMLLRIDEPRRIGLIGQILHLCHGLVDRDNEREAQIKPQVLQCVQVSRGLGISLDSLGLLESTRRWVNGLLERQLEVEDVGENPFGDPIKLSSAVVDEFVKICMDTKERLHRDSNSILDANTIHRMLMKCMGSYRELRQLIGKKEDITDSLMPTLLDAVKMLQGMVRLRNMYPEIIHELQEFQATLGEDGEITE